MESKDDINKLSDKAEEQQEAEVTEVADERVLDNVPLDITEIDLTHYRLKKLPVITKFQQLERLGLRQNLLTTLGDGFPEAQNVIMPKLEFLELYDNRLSEVESVIAKLTTLKHLDMSFNLIPSITLNLQPLVNLQALYLCQNKISRIEGLETLTNLKILELGANRIRTVEGLQSLVNLEELYLGKNKITSLGSGLKALKKLRILSVQSNRLQSLSDFDTSALGQLEELYLSHNGILAIDSVLEKNCRNLKILDLGNNRISRLENLSCLEHLEELWISNNQLSSYKEVEQQLKNSKKLTCIYLEGNEGISSDTQYRLKVKLALPQIKQLDATFIRA